jgi:hypothetical protein
MDQIRLTSTVTDVSNESVGGRMETDAITIRITTVSLRQPQVGDVGHRLIVSSKKKGYLFDCFIIGLHFFLYLVEIVDTISRGPTEINLPAGTDKKERSADC